MNKLIILSNTLKEKGLKKEASSVLRLHNEFLINKSAAPTVSQALKVKDDIIDIANFKNLPRAKKSQLIHNILGYIGRVPGIGPAADVLNIIMYAAEGEYYMAALSAISLVPGIDSILPGFIKSGKDLSPKMIVDYGSSFLQLAGNISKKISGGAQLIQAVQSIIENANNGKGISASEIQSAKQKSAVAINEIDIDTTSAVV
jgi:hypothetical protein